MPAQEPDIATNPQAVGKSCSVIHITWTNGSKIKSVKVFRHLPPLSATPPNLMEIYSASARSSLRAEDSCDDGRLSPGAYTYRIQSWESASWNGNPTSSTSDFPGSTPFGCPQPASGTGGRIVNDLGLAVSRGDAIVVFTTHNAEAARQRVWTLADTLLLPGSDVVQDSAFSLIRNTSGKLQVVAHVTPLQDRGAGQLVVYEFDLIPDPQTQPSPIQPMPFVSDTPPPGIIGNPALIQTERETLELLISVGGKILHYTHPGTPLGRGEWKLDSRILELPGDASPDSQFTAVSLMQNTSGQLEAIARVSPKLEGQDDYLCVFEFEPSPTSQDPIIAQRISTGDDQPIRGITGTSALLQSDPDTLTLLVPQSDIIGVYTHQAETAIEGPWTLVSKLPLPGEPGIEETAISLLPSYSIPGKLEAIAQVAPRGGLNHVRVYSYEFLPERGWSEPIPADLGQNGNSPREQQSQNTW